jgi:intracellular septation protein A
MTTSPAKPKKSSTSFFQLIVTFVLPLIVLTKFSSDSLLGPTRAMLLALSFPVVFELYNALNRRKPSFLSLLAIGGILVTGLISLLGLSEGWLAIRRSAPYLFGALVILISIWIKHPIVQAALSQILDMDLINETATKTKKTAALKRIVDQTGYMLSFLLLLMTIATYLMTRIVITSPTHSAAFNQEYAKLGLLSLPIISLPLLVGVVIIVMFLITKIEKLTGIDGENLLKKKQP